jgi:hypothetical protein
MRSRLGGSVRALCLFGGARAFESFGYKLVNRRCEVAAAKKYMMPAPDGPIYLAMRIYWAERSCAGRIVEPPAVKQFK